MQQIYANYTTTLSELKELPSNLLEVLKNEPIAILSDNKPNAYIVSNKMFERMMDIIDDYYLSKEVDERLNDNEQPIKVNLDDL